MAPIHNLLAFLPTLAQMQDPNREGRNLPKIDTGSPGMTWIIAALLAVGILFVTFKTSKRNHLDRD